jgi:transcriptional regulator with XRE-family HTH domain
MQACFARHLYTALMPDASRAHQLSKLRKAAGLSQRELARALDVHHSNVSFWERTGVAPRGEVLPKMAEILGVSVDTLLGENPRAKAAAAAPAGRARLAFAAVSKMPKRQQEKILSVVEAFVGQAKAG